MPRVAKMDASLKRYEKASRIAKDSADELSRVAHFLGASAVEKFRVAVLAEWAERAFLRDVVELRDAFAGIPPGGLPTGIEPFRLLPDALLQWLEEMFDLHTVGEIGKVLEIPADRLRNYSYDFDPPQQVSQLVSVRIVSRGWKRNKTLLIPPRIELVASTNAEELKNSDVTENDSESAGHQPS